MPNINAISAYMFAECRSLINYQIPQHVYNIGSYAFYNCIALKEIYNLSNIDITLGSSSNGEIALYAKTIHTSKDDTSNIVTDSNGYSFMYVDGEGYYLIGYSGNEEVLSLPESFD